MSDTCLSDLLGENGIFVDGDWVESKDQDVNGGVRLLQLADVGDGCFVNKSSRFLTPETAHRLRCTYLEQGDILIARMPDPIGRACIFPGYEKPCVTVVDVCVLRSDPQKVDRSWLLHNINSKEFRSEIDRYVMGATRQRVSRTNLNKVRFSLPPLPEQRRVAAVLDKADALRQKRRAALAKLNELLQSVFVEMFGDPVTNPMGWPISTIRDLISVANYGSSSKAGDAGAFPMLRMNNITYTGEWNFDSLKYIDLSDKEAGKYLVRKGEILFNRTNSKELVGKTAVYRRSDPMAFAGYLIRLKVGPLANAEYISSFLNSAYGKKILLSMCKSIVGMANINAQELQSIQIPQPPIDLQNQFAAVVEQIESLRVRQQAALVETEGLFASLQARAFAGDL